MIRRISFLILTTIGFYSCVQKANDRIVKEKYFPDEKVTVKQEFINDTIADGFYRQYYANGKLKIEASFVANLKHGVERGYFESGALRYIVTYDSGVRIGPTEWYYQNGQIEAKYENDNDKAVGDFFEYDSLGHLLSYGSRTFNGLIKFEEKFSTDGKIVSKFGGEVVDLDANSTILHVGDTIRLYILVATPPHTKCTLSVIIDDKEPQDADVWQIEEGQGKVLYEKRLLKKGHFNFVGTYTVQYSDTDKSQKILAGAYQVD